jgi:hypothetical protein
MTGFPPLDRAQVEAIAELLTHFPDGEVLLTGAAGEEALNVADVKAVCAAYLANHSRYQWAANELLACDYGDNDKGGVGWCVYGWRQPKDIQHHERKRIYGASIDQAIDAEIP